MQTLDAAAEVGIDIPKSVIPTSWVMVEQIAGNFPFPAVMKWPDPNAVASLLSQHDLAFEKAEHVRNSEEFLVAAKRYQSMGCWPMLQEYCPGVGLGQFFFMHQGRAVRRFQHMRVAEWPPEGGFSSVCDGIPLERFQSLQDKSIKLLQKIGWEGVAMIEYRYDAVRDRAVLMEINGRFWGSYPLAVASGAGFGLYAYTVGTSGVVPEIAPIKSGLRCRMISTEIKRLFRIIFRPNKIADPFFIKNPTKELLRFISDFFKPNIYYYIWSKDDHKPLLTDIFNAIKNKNI
jgi:predicted ATP-grasp superfamily ATP-dependent carboligase